MFDHLDDTHPFAVTDSFAAAVTRGAAQRKRRSVAGRTLAAGMTAVAVGAGALAWRVADVRRVEITTAQAPSPGSPVNVLLLGLDTRAGAPASQGRADVIVVARVNPAERSVRLLWIPRDLYLDGELAMKASALSTEDGASAFVETLESRFSIPIHHVAMIDMGAFEDLVDEWGGIDAHFSADARDQGTGFRIEAGCRHLDGADALAFVRSRHLETRDGTTWEHDPTGALGRDQRQTQLAQVLAEQLRASETSPARLLRLANLMSEKATVDSGLSIEEMIRLTRALSSADTFEVHTLPVVSMTAPSGMAGLSFVGTADEASALIYGDTSADAAVDPTTPDIAGATPPALSVTAC